MEQTAFLVHLRRDDAHSGWEHTIRATALAIGQSARVVSGPLEGLRGRLSARAEDGRWLLEVPDSGRGVLICIGGHQLTRD